MTKESAIKKVQRAIDLIMALQDCGYGSDRTARLLEQLNSLENEISNRQATPR